MMKGKLAAGLTVMGVLGLLGIMRAEPTFAAPQTADACGVLTCTLDNWNTVELQSSGDTVTVTLDTTADTLTFVYSDGGSTPPDFKNLKTIGWNVVNAGTGATGYTQTPGSGTLDGFGTFTVRYEKDSVSGTGPTTVVFSGITATTLVGATFAVHVQYTGDCSGWVGNGANAGTSTSSACGSTVPEPASLMLLGAGLAGIGIWRRKSVKV